MSYSHKPTPEDYDFVRKLRPLDEPLLRWAPQAVIVKHWSEPWIWRGTYPLATDLWFGSPCYVIAQCGSRTEAIKAFKRDWPHFYGPYMRLEIWHPVDMDNRRLSDYPAGRV